MFLQRVIFELSPLRHFLPTDRTEVSVILPLMLVQLHPTICPVVAHGAFVLNFARVDPLVQRHLCVRRKILVAEVALEGFGHHVGHLLVLPEFARGKEFPIAFIAPKTGVVSPMKLAPMTVQAILCAHIPNGRALEADVKQLTRMPRKILLRSQRLETPVTLDEVEVGRVLLRNVFFERVLIPESFITEGALRTDFLLVRIVPLGHFYSAPPVKCRWNTPRFFSRQRYRRWI